METADEFIERKNKKFLEDKNKPMKVKDIGRRGKINWIREDWIFMPQTNYPEKVFVVERFRRDIIEGKTANKFGSKLGDIEYRIGYYIVGKIGNKKGKWTWGQYCLIIPKEDLDKLIKLAREKEVIS